MDKNLIEKYKAEMLNMSKRAIPTQATAENVSNGELIVMVTAIRNLYPIENAKITVFKGSMENRVKITEALTNESGRTERIILPAPDKIFSETKGSNTIPYELYNLLVEADGYIDNIHLNIPIFSGVTSIQRVNLLQSESAGENPPPQIFDEFKAYEL